MANLPENLYYDLVVSNLDSNKTKPNPFHYSVQNSDAFLENPSQYDLSIVKFQIETSTAPVFIPSIQPYQGDKDLTIYSVTLGFNGVFSDQIYIRWRPQDRTALLPNPPTNGLQDNNSGYYFCYSYNWFCMLILEAFQEALDSLKSKTGTDIEDALPPVLYWNNGSSAGVIQAQTMYYDQSPQNENENINIYMNTAMFGLFNSFPSSIESWDSVIGANVKIQCYKMLSINTEELTLYDGTVDEFITIPQEYSTTLAWSPFTSIVFTSSSLPVQGTNVSAPMLIQNNYPLNTNNQLSTSENIITDLVSDDGQYRSGLTYSPAAEFRRITLFGNHSLTQMDLNIYFRTKLGGLVPFRLAGGGTVSIKLAFFKK